MNQHKKRLMEILENRGQELAQMIVDDLMTNGNGDKATRLVLVDDAYVPLRELGGWSRKALMDRITKILVGE